MKEVMDKKIDFSILTKPIFKIVEVDLNEHTASKGQSTLPNLSLYSIEDITIKNVQSIDSDKPGYIVANDGALEIPISSEAGKNKNSIFVTERSAREMASALNQQSFDAAKVYHDKAQTSMDIIDQVESTNKKKIEKLPEEE